jgi:hypothetical protein
VDAGRLTLPVSLVGLRLGSVSATIFRGLSRYVYRARASLVAGVLHVRLLPGTFPLAANRSGLPGRACAE